MGTVRVLLCIVCLIGAGMGWCVECGVVKVAPQVRNSVLAIAQSQLHVREKTGKNDGIEVS